MHANTIGGIAMSMSDYEVGAVMATADMKAAREFYEGKLGLTPDGDAPEDPSVPISYRCAKETRISVYRSPDHAGKSTATMVDWAVDDLESVVDELTANGVKFEQYDQEGLKTNDKGIVEFDGNPGVAFFRDPDGNTHAINQG
jgi:catechol 2,3-dioxygenase-like lactoylglutathione lyase family enzyme